MNSIDQLRALKPKKDLDCPVVSLKGFFGSTRALHAKFPAAQGKPFVVLKLTEIRCHGLTVARTTKGKGEAFQTTYELWFDCLAMGGRENSSDSFLLGEFNSKERANEALAAIEKLLNSTKKTWIAASVLAVAWVVLFMPMPRNQPAKAPMSVSSSYNSAPRIPGGGMPAPSGAGLLAPSISSLPMLGGSGLQAPGVNAVPAAAGISSSQAEQAVQGAQGAQAAPTAGPEDDPFGLKISPSGGGLPVKR